MTQEVGSQHRQVFRTGNYNPMLYRAIPDSREDIVKILSSSLYAGISRQAIG